MSNRRIRESSKRQALREQRLKRQRQQRFIIIGAIVVFVLVAAFLIIYPSLKPVGDFVKPVANPRPNPNFNSMGDPNAPVKIVEYSDYQCPFCKRFVDETEQQLIDTYIKTGKVYFTYVPYGPGPGGQPIGTESTATAKAAFCAGDQNKFWEYSDYIFANHKGENVGLYTDKLLNAFAQSIGLNMSDFQSCYSSNKFGNKLNDGVVQGQQAGVNGTPAFTINGKLLTGAVPFETFQQEIDTALAAAGQ